MGYSYLSLAVKGKVGVISITREKALNALNRQLLQELDDILEEVIAREDLRAVIITGRGKAFVAGADIGEMKDMELEDAKKFAALGKGVFRKIEELPLPVIAAINGYALGGGNELALACDIRIAASSSQFGQPETGLGIIPGFGGSQRLVRIVGEAIAKEILFTAQIFDARRALEIGLVNKVVADDKLMDTAEEMARTISQNAPLAVERAKEAVNRGREMTLARGLKYESQLFATCFTTSDQKKGMEAYLNKENIDFTGN